MPNYYYKAKHGLEETLEGSIEAANQDEALQKLIAKGLFPIVIKESSLKEKRMAKKFRMRIGPDKIKSGELLTFIRKLATLTRAKVELLSSLKILYEQTENERFKAIVLDLYNATKEGKPFSESLARYPDIFSFILVNIVKAGEASGHLDASLDQIAEFMQREEGLKNKILVALAYPGLLLMVGIVSIFVLINFVIPKLKPIFDSLGAKELPLITKIILNISVISQKSWWVFVIAIVLFALFLYQQKGLPYFKSMLSKLKSKVPIVKSLSVNQELAHFSRSLALLLTSGVPALRSLEIVTPSIENKALKEGLKKVCQQVAAGKTISKSMEDSTGLPTFFTKMVAVGEESGRLSEVLTELSRSYTQQIESDIVLVSSLIEPVLILALGLVLGTIVLSILLPTFQVTQMVR
ncbi:MAG: type II secretion system F family protein [Candidatus Omnitrophica bacterium]|nr:type II secretion system F family protein [Candidatus Omnitrophota bacterium]